MPKPKMCKDSLPSSSIRRKHRYHQPSPKVTNKHNKDVEIEAAKKSVLDTINNYRIDWFSCSHTLKTSVCSALVFPMLDFLYTGIKFSVNQLGRLINMGKTHNGSAGVLREKIEHSTDIEQMLSHITNPEITKNSIKDGGGFDGVVNECTEILRTKLSLR